jgi:hypothetical protein
MEILVRSAIGLMESGFGTKSILFTIPKIAPSSIWGSGAPKMVEATVCIHTGDGNPSAVISPGLFIFFCIYSPRFGFT